MIRHIEIPTRLIDKLLDNKGDRSWLIKVEQINQNIADYFYRTPYFFPEYTDHGVLHIQKVLDICNKLIPEDSLEKLSPKEVGVLIVSIMIHDIGMFIHKDGLKELIYGSLKNTKIEFLDTDTWEQVWKDYVLSVKRYSDKKLMKIFGNSEPIQFPDKQMDNLSERDILLYGDFLRQVHGRLAHTIVKEGFLGTETVDIFRNTKLDENIKDIIGLIARSHCMPLRDCREFLDNSFLDIRKPKNISIFYIMSLLRMADYLDAGYDRASHVISSMQFKKSVISKEEYCWNEVIDYDDYEWIYDAEALAIHADPKNSNDFLKIEEWLKNVQRELDMSWAVLGEYYGSNSNLNISIRRIDSNILKKETRKVFERKFVTRKAILDTNPDILGLLIFPLYDNNPLYGIREILQNAIDACKERMLLEQNRKVEYTPNINLEIDTSMNTITITDNGIGMDEDIIINYFLVSGASFRNSEIWNKYFTLNDNAQVSRTGKFGIGALAIFLLGGKATIKTKRMDFESKDEDNRGYLFTMEVSGENICIERVDTEIGTQIVIFTKKEIIQQIIESEEYPRWYDWYCFDVPIIHYYLDHKEIFHEEELVPDENEEFDFWYKLDVGDFKSYKWSYEHKIMGDINSYCNGIPIPKRCKVSGEKYGFELADPVISVVDYDDKIEINLARSQLSKFPCEKQFVIEGYKYVIAKLLSRLDSKNLNDFWNFYDKGFDLCKGFGYKRTLEISPGAYLLSDRGYTLMTPTFLYNADVKQVKVVFVKMDYLYCCKGIEMDAPMYICCVGNRKRRTFFMDIFKGIFNNSDMEEIPFCFDVEKQFFDGELKALYDKFGILKNWKLTNSNSSFYRFTIQNGNNRSNAIKLLDENMGTKILAVLSYEIYYKKMDNIMVRLLTEYLGYGWIPYKLSDKKEQYKEVFEKLERYII